MLYSPDKIFKMASSRFATVTQEEIEKYRENSVMILFLILKNTIIIIHLSLGEYWWIFTSAPPR